MSTVRYRGWRFLVPGLDAADEFAGLGVTTRGSIDMAADDEAVRQAILLLLSTAPGERVMRPDYGCELHRLVFSPNDDTTAGLAIYYARRARALGAAHRHYALDAGRSPEEPQQLDVLLEYRVRATQRSDTLAFSFNLSGRRIDVLTVAPTSMTATSNNWSRKHAAGSRSRV
jgi:hypothetical protein